MQRRAYLQATGLAVGDIGAGALLSSQPVRADITTEELSINGAEATTQDGSISDVTVSVSGSWEYNVPSGKEPDSWNISFVVENSNGDSDTLASTSGEAMYLNADGSYSLSESLTDTSLYDISDFAQDSEGQTTSVDLTFRLIFEVLNPDGTVIAGSELQDAATVSVTNEQYSVEEHGTLDGSGNITISE